ncbi:MAG: TIGR03790 family protein [Desulfobacterales bacterium]|nr:TIGR03790 family protein [Desulfobacterales bacterium]
MLARQNTLLRGCPFAIIFAIVASILLSRAAWAISPENVLVVYNINSPAGTEITNYYAQAHPGVQTLGLTGIDALDEQITADDYLNVLRPQVLAALNSDIDVIVTTKGLPLHIQVEQSNPGSYTGWRGSHPIINWPTIDATQWQPYSSLESELMRIDRISSYEQMGDQAYILGDSALIPLWGSDHQGYNPYYGASDPFRHDDPNKVALDRIRLSTRLDAFSVDDVKAMIDRAYMAVVDPPDRDFIVDSDPEPISTRMASLSFELSEAGVAHKYNNTDVAITQSAGDVLGYVSMGTNDGAGGLSGGYVHNQLNLNLANGAVFASYESYNASTFNPLNSQYQALIAEWIEIGGTAALGQVWEGGDGPANVTNEDLFFEYMLAGYTFAEAFAFSTTQLSYVNTAIGDPLMRWVPRLAGDADLDQMVNSSDLALLTINFLESGGWSEGDFNGDGLVNPSDLAIMTLNFGMTNPALDPGGGSGTNAVVPEPELGLWMLIAGVALLARRGHRVHRVRMSLDGKASSD